jgi:hypothetical protein
MPSIGGIKGTNEGPVHTTSLPVRQCGIAYAGAVKKFAHLEGDGTVILLKVGL